MTPKKTPLDRNLHLRIPINFEESLAQVAASYNMKKSTFSRVILMRELNNYTRNRLFT